MAADTPATRTRVAYLSLQAVAEGQDSWAAVLEVIRAMRAGGWTVDEWFPGYQPGANPGRIARLREMFRLQRVLVRHLRDYDILYVRSHVLAYWACRAARRRGIPMIRECHGSYEDLFIAWPATRYARPLFEWLGRSQLRDADAVIAVTPGLADWVRSETGRAACDVSANGANTDAFTPDAPRRADLPPRYVAFFGQFAAWQGIGVILAALADPGWPRDVSLVMVGDGALRPEVEAAAAGDPRLVYLGKLPYMEVAGVVAGAIAALVMTFSPERAVTGFSPLKLYESMACGVPIIVSATGRQEEVVVAERCGLVVPAGDPAALATAVATLAGDPDGAAEMGRRSREAAVARHSWAARARERMAITVRAAAEARARRPRR